MKRKNRLEEERGERGKKWERKGEEEIGRERNGE